MGDYIRPEMVGPDGPVGGPKGELVGWWLEQVDGRLVWWNQLVAL